MKRTNPPRWSIAFFRWFCNDHLSEAVLGDMLELYDRRVPKIGKRKADLLFIWNVIQFMQPFAIRKKSGPSTSLNSFDMISNYFKIAWRSMVKQKLYTGITIGGFAVSIATCILIALFIKSELSHDNFYKDQGRIFRLYNDYGGPDGNKWVNVQTPLTGVIRQDMPDVELAGRILNNGMGVGMKPLVRRTDQADNTYEDKVAYADPEILQILEIKMVRGDAKKALNEPSSVVISRTKAQQYFGDTDPIGKSLIFNDAPTRIFTIAGVMEDYRNDTHFQYDMLLSLSGVSFWTNEQTDFCCWNYQSYIKLREGVSKADFEQKLIKIRDIYTIGYMEKMGSKNIDDFRKHHSYKMQPVEDIWLQGDIGDPFKHGDMDYIWLFGGIAVFILILACINFINLSTARSANRAKEVGLRKVVGSLRRSLISQFLTESILNSIISFVIAIVLVWAVLPSFSMVADRQLSMPWATGWYLPLLLAASIIIGVAAGLYPSLYLSSYKPIDVLKGKLRLGARSGSLRSGMVVFQFSASIILIIGTMVINRQMDFMMQRNIGFDKDQVMVLEGTHMLHGKKEAFRNELLKLSGVENVSISGYLPVAGANREGYAWWKEGKQQTEKSVNAQKWRVDPDYISTMKMKIVQGRDFIRGNPSDTFSIIINQKMARELGFQNPIGERITNNVIYTIIGVVEDFNYSTMKDPVRPLCLVIEKWGDNSTAVRLSTTDLPNTIEQVEKVWHSMLPNQPFNYSFLDDRFEHMYDDVIRAGRLFGAFATLAIIVACLGLFALSAFMIEQRSKEISIRLVMGAPLQSIFKLLTSNFMKLVMISWFIGTPLSWWLMNKWLENFEYREPIAISVFVISGSIAIAIALFTVSYQSVKAALTNPIRNLRNE